MIDCEALRLFDRYQEQVLLGRAILSGARPELKDRVEFHFVSWDEGAVFGALQQIHVDPLARLCGHRGIVAVKDHSWPRAACPWKRAADPSSSSMRKS